MKCLLTLNSYGCIKAKKKKKIQHLFSIFDQNMITLQVFFLTIHVIRSRPQTTRRWRRHAWMNPEPFHWRWIQRNVMRWSSSTTFKCLMISSTSGTSAKSFILTTPAVCFSMTNTCLAALGLMQIFLLTIIVENKSHGLVLSLYTVVLI